MFTSKIIPAIIPQSLEHLESELKKIVGLPEVHIDVVDGIFASSVSWPYKENCDVVQARNLLDRFSLEVDLMVQNPLQAAELWLEAGADQLVFHVETLTAIQLQNFRERHDVTIGVSISSDTPLSKLDDYLPCADYVQLMGIKQIGSQGQPFDQSVLSRVASLQSAKPNFPISIDGSVNEHTLPQIATHNLARYIVGSGIMAALSPKEAYMTLTKLTQ